MDSRSENVSFHTEHFSVLFFLTKQGYLLENSMSKVTNTLFDVIIPYFNKDKQLCASDQAWDLSAPVHFICVQLNYIVHRIQWILFQLALNADLSGFPSLSMPASHSEPGSIYFKGINQIFCWDTRLFNFANDKGQSSHIWPCRSMMQRCTLSQQCNE